MVSKEYVDSIKLMMEHQDRYFNWFLAILSIVLVFVGFVQWRFSTKQIEQLKEKTKRETVKEIEETLGVLNLVDFKNEIQKNFKDIESERNMFEYLQLDYKLTELFNQEHFLGELNYLMDIYRSYLLRSFGNFNYFVSRIESILSIRYGQKKIDIHSETIDRIIKKMRAIENTFSEKSEILKKLEDHLSYYRRIEKKKD